MPSLRLGLFLACLACATVGPLTAADSPPSGAKYRPQLAPHFAEGDVFTYNATAEFGSAMRVETQTRKPKAEGPDERSGGVALDDRDDFQIEFVADKALARQVFNNGSLREAEFLVVRCREMDASGQAHELVPPGTVIGARKQKDGQIAFAVNGRAPDPTLAMRLSIIIPMGDERNTFNELLTPPAPKAAGEQWPVNEKAMLASDLAELFTGVDQVAGGVTFQKVLAENAGGPRGLVYSEYNLGDVHPPFPEGVDAFPSQVSFKVLAKVPLTPGPGQYDLQLNAVVRHQGQTGNSRTGLSQTSVRFSINVQQNLHYAIGTGGPAPASLTHAPAEPDAPPLAPGLSSAPFLRPEMAKNDPTATPAADQSGNSGNPTSPAMAKGASAAKSAASPSGVPEPAPPPFILHEPISPYSGVKGLSAPSKDTSKSN